MPEIEKKAVEWLDAVRLHRTTRERARLLGSNSAEFYARFAPTACRTMLRFLDLWDHVRATAGEELRTYLTGLAHGIRGNIDWAATVPRYVAGGPRG